MLRLIFPQSTVYSIKFIVYFFSCVVKIFYIIFVAITNRS